MNKQWWKSTAIYQVTLSSFFDSNNDGIGDLDGLRSKLGYLKDLGIGTVWISPHYDSPMDDNGYDVRNFYKVNPDYGNLEDFKKLINEAHKMNMRIITDLVLNHTSDEMEWFKIACDPNHKDYDKYHNFYIWQKPKYDDSGNRMRPTRWLSWFGGPTWDYIPEVDEYYLHIFSKKMPDLNWRNEELRNEMKNVVKFWADLGVDGFRVDAANHLEKNWDFPDAFPGFENFSSIPRHHDYIEELGKELFIPNNLLTIGESGGATKEQALKYVGYDSNEFNLLIHFGHVWADTDDSNGITTGKWGKGSLRVSDIKGSFNHWFTMLKDKGWNLIYWHNHDHPRIVSHYGNDKEYREISAKMLAIVLYFMPGTTVTYQGEEIGMTNVLYEDIKEFRDVEVFTEYNNFLKNGASVEMAMQALRDRSRDNARSPMQWTSGKYSGFSTTTPWMNVNYNYKSINVENEIAHKDSILDTYKFVLKHRKADEDNIIYGDIEFIDIDSQKNFMYINRGLDKDYLVLANFTDETIEVNLEQYDIGNFHYFFSNTISKPLNNHFVLAAYEAYVFTKNK
ncbi:alpha-glucosidase [Mycoplasmatota bacterium WC30]